MFRHDGRIFRALSQTASSSWRQLSQCDFFHRLTAEGKLIGSRETGWSPDQLAALTPEAGTSPWVGALEHDAIPFISYPYEWPFGMLRDGALLHLELLRLALADGMILKDASPYNVQWRGHRPVFIDISSFEPWRQGDPWVGYLQFCQLFLYPLMLTSYRDVPFHPWLRGAIDGIPPQVCDRLLSWRDRLRRGVLTHVYLQARLRERSDRRTTDRSLRSDLQQIGFSKEMILNNLEGLERIVRGLDWGRDSSEWVAYADDNSYDEDGRAAKETFVASAAATRRWNLVWDLGANTGQFSRLVAPHAEQVIAFDGDHLSVERLYRSLHRDGPENILPLVCNLADASPALGWRHRERQSLTQRPRPELTLCLALIHHLVISANIPLPDAVDWLTSLGPYLVIEFVTKDDAMVQRLLRNKDDLYDDYSLAAFEASLARRCEILDRRTLPSTTRVLYFARRL